MGRGAGPQIQLEYRLDPIIALSAHALQGEREKAIGAGCDEFEAKPIDMSCLLEKMNRLLATGHR